MAKTLVLAEKPSVGKELARVLGCRKNGSGFFSGDRYIVTWALGHLVTLADPEAYGKQYKTWSMETLPMLPKKMELCVIPQTAKQYSVVKNLLHSKEVDSLIIATDAGREGELVARWILAKAGFRKPIKRLWISSQTDKAIKQGFSNLRDGREYQNLYLSAQGRAEADWLVGLNVTRALTCKYNAQLSAGRVQTPTLSMIVAREEDIRRFVPKDYYTVQANLGNFHVNWHDAKGQNSTFDRDKADAVAEKVKNQTFRITDLKTTEKRTPPPLLYDLTELQRDGNKLYGYSPKQTLNFMQSLYERHKALTYPRTDSRYLTDDIVPTLPERLKAVMVGEFAPVVRDIIGGKRSIAKSCVNNAKVSDHHAIIPTEQPVNLSDLTNDERRIYLLVVRRFLTCFYGSYVFKQQKAELEAGGEKFSAVGRETVDKGWKKVYDFADEEELEEQDLPALKRGDSFSCKNVQVKSGKTKPPARYTEATLLSAMENPSAFISDKSMKEYIGGGLGTPATRADIIEKLFSSFYVEKQGQSIVPTSKGIQLVKLAPKDLREPLLTAKWEQQLEAISKGKYNKDAFIGEIEKYAKKLVQTVATSEEKYTHDNLTGNVCPQCGKFMLSVNGKRGKMLVCQDRECGYRESVSIKTNARCPQCHKTMELFGKDEKKTYRCQCGYRERAESFHKRMSETSSGMSKKQVQQYLNKQKSADTGMSALELAMKKAMEQKK